MKLNRLVVVILALLLVVPLFRMAGAADAADPEYQIFPTPQSVRYADGSQTLRSTMTVVTEPAIDDATRARLTETLDLAGATSTAADTVPTKSTASALLVGVHGSGGPVDRYVADLVASKALTYDAALFDKTDSYLLASIPSDGKRPDLTIVLGRDTDSAFYGLTTLRQIIQQLPGSTLRAFTISDWADVVTRGFIEGYYGEPWSVTDRINLMKWGGYYKLNAYIYAPKDDPKHNAQWRELYTSDELTRLIDPLAKAGNDSKTRFVFALHPFMSNPITTANYDESLKVLQAKYRQVIDHGVRQIAILADDAADQGSALYTKLLQDMTDWIHGLQAETKDDGTPQYPGLKDTIIFCPVNYFGQGESWYADLPSNIQVINTGGQVWGKVDQAFVSRFKANSAGRSPFMWINWPVTDNDKDALHMGGASNFLGSDLKPGDVEGVVLNPMQQSEPSKAAIFMNADFSWHLWTDPTYADTIWEKSFSYVDHNSPLPTPGSDALRELSRNMLQVFGGGQTWPSGESANIVGQLSEFATKLQQGTLADSDVVALEKVFTDIAANSKTYRTAAGNSAMRDQMKPWLDTWDDFTAAAVEYLQSLQGWLKGDNAVLLSHYLKGKEAFDKASNHGFSYIDHTEYARVGKLYLWPFVSSLGDALGRSALLIENPTANPPSFITNRTDTPLGADSTDVVFDGNRSTGLSYRTPNAVNVGMYFGLTTPKPFTLNQITFVMGTGKNFIQYPKLQVKRGNDWVDVAGQDAIQGSQTVTVTGLNEADVTGVRLIARQANDLDSWPEIDEIILNGGTVDQAARPSISGQGLGVYQNNVLTNAIDGDPATIAWVYDNTTGAQANIKAGNAITLTFDQPTEIDGAHLTQGPGDVITAGALEYSVDGTTWQQAGTVTNSEKQNFSFDPVTVRALRIRVTQGTNAWWKVAEFGANAVTTTGSNTITNTSAQLTATVRDGVATLDDATVQVGANQFAAIDLGAVRHGVTVNPGESVLGDAQLVYSSNGLEWVAVPTSGTGVTARYVGVRSQTATSVTFTGLTANYTSVQPPSMVSSDIGNFDASQVFDGQLATMFTNKQGGSNGDTVVFDLGRTRQIHQLAYYVPESSLNFIRNAVVEVSTSADGPWVPALQINGSTPVPNTFNSDTAKDATWLTHDPAHPGNMYTSNPKTDVTRGNENDPNGTTPLDLTARFLRLRFTGTYTYRWVAIGEFQINNGEYVSPYGAADFESTVVEEAGHSPIALTDNDTQTYWQPSEDSGTLTYHVSTPVNADGDAVKGLRIISQGTPSGATVSASVYTDDTYSATTTVPLGVLGQPVSEFSFNGKVVKDVVVKWTKQAPKISEVFMLSEANQADTADLQATYDRLKATDTSGWTAQSRADFEAALQAAKSGLESGTGTQFYVDALTTALDQAASMGIPRYVGTELAQLVATPVTNDDKTYTAESFGVYADDLKLAADALTDTANLSRTEGERLAAQLQADKAGLVFNASAKDRAVQASDDSAVTYQPAVDAGAYTDASVTTWKAALDAISTLARDATATPAQFLAATEVLSVSEKGLTLKPDTATPPVTPPTSPVTPPTPPVTPPTSPVTPPTSPVTPPTSPVTPPTSPVTPLTSPVTPPTPPVTPPTGFHPRELPNTGN